MLQHRRIIDAVAHKGQHFSLGHLSLQLLHVPHLVGWKQFGMILFYAQSGSYIVRHFVPVAREHHGAADAQLLQFPHRFGAPVLHLVADDYMPGVFAIDSYVDDGAHAVALVPLDAQSLHHARVAHTYLTSLYHCLYTLAGHLFHLADAAAVGGLLGEGIAQGRCYGMGAEMLYVCCHVQQLVPVGLVGMYGHHGKASFGECAGLVEDHTTHLGQPIYSAAALDENAAARGSAYASEEGERDADDQCTRAGYHQEDECPVEPGGEGLQERLAHQQRGQQSQCQCGSHHDGGVDACEAGDEGFAVRLAPVLVLHHADDLAHGAFSEAACGLYLQHAIEVHAARDYLVALLHVAWQTLASECRGVERRCSLAHDAVQRYLLARLHQQDFSDGHLLGRHFLGLAVAYHARHIGPQVHQMAYAAAALPLCVMLEKLSHLEEEHDEHSLHELRPGSRKEADGECTQRGNGHE